MKWSLVLVTAVFATTISAEIGDYRPEDLDEDLASRTSRQFFSSSGLVFPGPRTTPNENQRPRITPNENQRPRSPPSENQRPRPPPSVTNPNTPSLKPRRPIQNRPSANPDKDYETPAQKKSTQFDEGSFVPVFAPSANGKPSVNPNSPNHVPRPSSGPIFREDSANAASFSGDRFNNNDKSSFPQPSPSNTRFTQSFERPNLSPIPNDSNDRPSFSNEAQLHLRNPEPFPSQDFGPSPFLRPSSSPRPERPDRPERLERPDRLERPEPPFAPFNRPDDERSPANAFGRPSNNLAGDFPPVRPTPPQSRPVAQSPRPVPLSTTQEFSPVDVPTPNTRPSPTTPLRPQQPQQQQQRVTRPPTPTLTKPRPTPAPRPPQQPEEYDDDEDEQEEERYSRPSAPARQEYAPERKPTPAPKKPAPKPRPAPVKPKPQPERKPAPVEEEEEDEDDEPEKPDRLTELLKATTFHCKEKKDGYYANEELDCEVFHYCQDRVRHSWLCPAGAAFHQVHLICMPVGKENICQKSSEFHFVNDYLYKTIDDGTGDNSSQTYADRYYPEGYEPGLSQLDADTLVVPNSLKFKPHGNQKDQYSKQKQNSPSRPVHQRPPQRIQPQYDEDDYDDEESSILPSFRERPDPRLRPRPYGEESRKVQVTQPAPRVTSRPSKEEATSKPSRPSEAAPSSVSPIEEEFDD